jgi:hypothetical protein
MRATQQPVLPTLLITAVPPAGIDKLKWKMQEKKEDISIQGLIGEE